MATELKNILFGKGDYQSKKQYIEDMTIQGLSSITKNTIREIIEKCDDTTNVLCIPEELQNGNNLCKVDKVYANQEGVYLSMEILEFNYIEDFDKFFRFGEYFKKLDNKNVYIDFTASQKCDVMRSILLTCIYRLLMKKLLDPRLIFPVYDHFYEVYGLGSRHCGKGAQREDVAVIEAFSFAKRELIKFVEKYLTLFDGLTPEILISKYKGFFGVCMNNFIKDFDFCEWKAEHHI